MDDQKAAENAAKDRIEDWISEENPGASDQREGIINSSKGKTRINSSSFDANMKHNSGNTGERLQQDAGTKSVAMAAASPISSKRADSSSGLRQKSGVQTGRGSSLRKRSRYPPCDHQLRLGNETSSFANFTEKSSRSQTSNIGVSQSCKQQSLSKLNIEQPSIYLFAETRTSALQDKTRQMPMKTSWSQSSHDSKQMGNLCTASISQHLQYPSLQSCLSGQQPQLPQFQYDASTALQRQHEIQNDPFGLLKHQSQQQQMSGIHSYFPKFQAHQNLFDVSEQPEAVRSRQNFSLMSQPMHLPQNLGRSFPSEGMREQQQRSTSLQTQSSTAGEQMKQIEQSHIMLPEISSALNSQTNSSIWYDQVYQQVLRLRESYLEDLIKDYKRAQELCTQPSNAETKVKRERKRVFVEKVIMFLQMSRAEFEQYSKEKVQQHMKLILWYLNQVRTRNASPSQQNQQLQQSGSQLATSQLQQRGDENPQIILRRQDMTSTLVGAPQLSTQKGPLNSQGGPTNSIPKGALGGRETTESSSVNLLRYDPVRSAKQDGPIMPQKANMSIAPHVGSQSKFEQRTSSSFPTGPAKNIYHSAMSASQQANSSSREIANKLDSIMSSHPLNPTPSLSQIITQQEKFQMMQAQKVQQPMQLAGTCQNESTVFVQKESEINKSSLGQVMGYQRLPQQHHLIGRHIEHYPHGWVPSSTSKDHVASSHASQLPSPLVDLMDVSSERASSPVQPTASPGRNQLDKQNSHVLPRSSLSEDTTLPENSEQSHAQGEGFSRLIKAIKSISPEALAAGAKDIKAVVHLTDRTAGSCPYEDYREYIGKDLAYDMRGNEHDWETLIGTASEKRMNRHLSAMALDGQTSPSCTSDHLQWSNGSRYDKESFQNSTFKRLKTKHSDFLLQEINEINQKLIETVVDVNLDGKDASAETDKGTTVRFSYTPVGHEAASLLTNLLMQVLVAADYPSSSPIVLDALPEKLRENEELKGVWENAFSKFNSSIQKCSHPIPLGKMAMTWDASTRDAFREFAEKLGGGSFSSKYGKWENCEST